MKIIKYIHIGIITELIWLIILNKDYLKAILLTIKTLILRYCKKVFQPMSWWKHFGLTNDFAVGLS